MFLFLGEIIKDFLNNRNNLRTKLEFGGSFGTSLSKLVSKIHPECLNIAVLNILVDIAIIFLTRKITNNKIPRNYGQLLDKTIKVDRYLK